VGRSKQAPWDFECPYQHNCPHLEGFSTTWTNIQLKGRDRDWDELNRVVQEQGEEIAALTPLDVRCTARK